MNKRLALVTGGAGFIGSHIAERLIQEGWEVKILDDLSTGLEQNIPTDAIFIMGSITDPVAISAAFESTPDLVVHIAGQASTIRSFHNPIDDVKINLIGTANMIDACLKTGVERLLYASSMTVYGENTVLPISETSICNPISYYGISKLAAERFVMATALRNDLKTSLNVTSFRMFNVYGPRQRLDNPYQGVCGIFLGAVLRNEPIEIHGDGEQSRDFIYINDVVEAWMRSIDNPETYKQVINLGSSSKMSIKSLAWNIIRAAGLEARGYPMVSAPARPGDQRHMQADIQKAMTLLNWIPAVSFMEGMTRTVQWAKSNSEFYK